MQYTVRVIAEDSAHNGAKTEKIFTTPDVLAPSTKEMEHRFQIATDSRSVLGELGNVKIFIDGFGQVIATSSDGKEHRLSRWIEQRVDHLVLRCEMVQKNPPKRVDDRTVPLRLRHWLTRARCHRCLFFNAATAQEWRDRVTHQYSDGQVDRMNHDITKMVAEQFSVPDMVKGEFGYCAKQHVGLSGTLPACKQYRRRTHAVVSPEVAP